MTEDFYWRNARDSIITPAAIKMFQIMVGYDGQVLQEVKGEIDHLYETATGRAPSARHGGNILTWVRAFQEAGWVELEPKDENERIKITEAGKQASVLLGKLPDFLKVVPYFVIELLTRFQINNPARPKSSRNPEYDKMLEGCNVFPYWTLYKIMRESDLYITADELRRFVFKIKKADEITGVIETIKNYRQDKDAGLTVEQLDTRYPPELVGAIAEPKYIMGRLGIQVGKYPPVIIKDGTSKWLINKDYLPFIDDILLNAPVFKEHLTEKSWMAEHGKCIEFWDELILPPGIEETEEDEELTDELADDDPIWLQTKDLLEHGAAGIILSGPPGTSKTWYAARIAIKLARKKAKQIKHLQFHPSYNYDDFIEGYVPASGDEGDPFFKPVDKIFLKLCEAAQNDPTKTYILVIDEFSRGDPSRIFGELLTYIEKCYRNKKFTLPYSGKNKSIPDNIVILGTMNPYDKSVSDLDAAMERRFEKISLDPNIDTLKQLLTNAGMPGPLREKVIIFFNKANKIMPHGFGHTYFLGAQDEQDIIRLWNHKIKFLFEKTFRFESQVYNDLREEYKKILGDSSKLS